MGATASAASTFVTEETGECNFDELATPDIEYDNESELQRKVFDEAKRGVSCVRPFLQEVFYEKWVLSPQGAPRKESIC